LAPNAGVRDWARSLFGEVIDHLAMIDSPRTKAFKILGTVALLRDQPGHAGLLSFITDWSEHLVSLFRNTKQENWKWFEPVLAYDNARLPEALIRAGMMLRRDDLVSIGIEALEWLDTIQISPEGHFTAIGSDSFNRPFAEPLSHDQQPLEAAAMVDACDAAFLATNDSTWRTAAINAYQWFLGKNANGMKIGNPETGGCFDALTPTGVNLNQGAESLLAFHLATLAIQPHVTR
ncbi:MAG: glycosyl transferase family 1, partial [Sphingorhabdus sp.]